MFLLFRGGVCRGMGACKEKKEKKKYNNILKMEIFIEKLCYQRIYDIGGGHIWKTTPGLKICFICEQTYLQLMMSFLPEHKTNLG